MSLMTTEQTHSDDEDYVIWSKPPEQAQIWPWVEISLTLHVFGDVLAI